MWVQAVAPRLSPTAATGLGADLPSHIPCSDLQPLPDTCCRQGPGSSIFPPWPESGSLQSPWPECSNLLPSGGERAPTLPPPDRGAARLVPTALTTGLAAFLLISPARGCRWHPQGTPGPEWGEMQQEPQGHSRAALKPGGGGAALGLGVPAGCVRSMALVQSELSPGAASEPP